MSFAIREARVVEVDYSMPDRDGKVTILIHLAAEVPSEMAGTIYQSLVEILKNVGTVSIEEDGS